MASSARPTGGVTTVYWDISNRCNGRCTYCSASSVLREPPGMPVDTAEALRGLRRLRRAGAEGVVFLGGEPTLRDDLVQLVAAARSLGLSVSIATNGLSMPRVLQLGLLEQEGLAINFSLDSSDPAENDAVRGSGHHEACTRTMRELLELRQATGAQVRISIQATLTLCNLARIEVTLLRLLDLGADRVLLDRMKTYPWQPAEVRALAPGPEQWIAAAGAAARAGMRTRLCDEWRIRINYGLAILKDALAGRYEYPMPAERQCPGGLAVAVIDAGGDLHPCRATAAQPPPTDAQGHPQYTIEPVDIRSPKACRFLESPYFVDFFNFAHSRHTYERLALCRECEHYAWCEPCPLDIAAHGETVLRECRALWAGCLP
jgi:MoaA/NifB/PqqE/SkfB family radical SAM enzyme